MQCVDVERKQCILHKNYHFTFAHNAYVRWSVVLYKIFYTLQIASAELNWFGENHLSQVIVNKMNEFNFTSRT